MNVGLGDWGLNDGYLSSGGSMIRKGEWWSVIAWMCGG